MKSIAVQDFPSSNYEIIVVNNNSMDNTESVCKLFQQEFPDISFRYVVEIQQGLSFARNRGIEESSGEIVVYVDDDATAFMGYLQAYDDCFRNHQDAIAAGGAIYPVFDAKNIKWMSTVIKKLLGGYLYYGNSVTLFTKGKYPGGGNAAYYKSAFQQYGVFNTELGRKGNSLLASEEKDVFDRFRTDGKPVYYVPKAAIYHHIPSTRLTNEYINRLSLAIGISEKKRTCSVSKEKYIRRIILELINWGGCIAYFFAYTLIFQPQKGIKFLQFRWYISKGLLASEKNNTAS
jgi:glycosyltransferase involved in cell wall biosynthesis